MFQTRRHICVVVYLQCAVVCCSVLQCVAVCCSVAQCVAVWRGRLDRATPRQLRQRATHCNTQTVLTATHRLYVAVSCAIVTATHRQCSLQHTDSAHCNTEIVSCSESRESAAARWRQNSTVKCCCAFALYCVAPSRYSVLHHCFIVCCTIAL